MFLPKACLIADGIMVASLRANLVLAQRWAIPTERRELNWARRT